MIPPIIGNKKFRTLTVNIIWSSPCMNIFFWMWSGRLRLVSVSATLRRSGRLMLSLVRSEQGVRRL